MINTFLFDLDGTLLSMEWDTFEKAYFGKLSSKLINYFEPEFFIKSLWKSILKEVNNTGGARTNKEVFFEDFIERTGTDANMLYPIFDEFYANEYDELKILAKPEIYCLKTVELLKKRGYDMIIATNPVFPLEAIRKRIKWAGLDEAYFKYVTCYENMHYCKPNVKFYEEVIDIAHKKPSECIMVGNDVEEDLVAADIGISTFLVEDHMIHRGKGRIKADYRGTYKDLYRIVRDNFPPVAQSADNNLCIL